MTTTELKLDEPLIEGAYYEDVDGDIIGPMKTTSNGWSGRDQTGRRKSLGYYTGGMTPTNRPPLIRRVPNPDGAAQPPQPRGPEQTSAVRTGGYDYATERQHIFTEGGQRMFLSIRDRSKALLKTAGAFRLQEVIAGETGDTWHMLACVDRLVELKEIVEVSKPGVPGQFRVFTT